MLLILKLNDFTRTLDSVVVAKLTALSGVISNLMSQPLSTIWGYQEQRIHQIHLDVSWRALDVLLQTLDDETYRWAFHKDPILQLVKLCAALKIYEPFVQYNLAYAFQALSNLFPFYPRQIIFRFNYAETIYELFKSQYVSSARQLCYGFIHFQDVSLSCDYPDFQERILDRLFQF